MVGGEACAQPLCGHGQACDLPPDLESLPHFLTGRGGREPVAPWAKVGRDGPIGGEDALGVSRGFELLPPSLALARRLVGVFGTGVQVAVRPMLDAGEDLALGRPMAPQLIGDDPPRGVRQALQPLPEDSLGRLLVSPALHQHVADIPLLVHGSPQIVPCAMDGQKHRIQVPRIARPRAPAAQLMGTGRPTFPPPRPPRVVGESDAACGHAPSTSRQLRQKRK